MASSLGSVFCLLCETSVDESFTYQFPACPCRFCLNCVKGNVEGQLLNLIHAVSPDVESTPEHDCSASPGTGKEFRLLEMSSVASELGCVVAIECPGCARKTPLSSVQDLATDSMPIWEVLWVGKKEAELPELVPARSSNASEGEKLPCNHEEPGGSRPLLRAGEKDPPANPNCMVCEERLVDDLAYHMSPCQCVTCLPCVQTILISHIECAVRSGPQAEDAGRLNCLGCGSGVPLHSLKDLFPEWVQRLDDERKSAELISKQALLPCPSCGLLAVRVPSTAHGASTSTETDDNGKLLSTAAALHKSQHRFRCPQCENNYCGNCNAVPYHLGRTCEEQVAFLRRPSCRFCGQDIPGCKRQAAKREGRIWGLLPFTGNPGDAAKRDRKSKSHLEEDEFKRLMEHVCSDNECQEKAKLSCTRTHATCGHPCGGIKGEEDCLPCLHKGCQRESPVGSRSAVLPSAEELCPVCVAEPLSSAPTILLKCGHVVHASCSKEMVQRGYPGPEISFRFLQCPARGELMQHPYLHDIMAGGISLKSKVDTMIDDKIKDSKEFMSEDEKQQQRALLERKCLFFACNKCKEPFYGGERECGAAADDEAAGETELTCERCSFSDWSGTKECTKGHGDKYIQYKCRFCCSPATFFCFGTTHFCTACHNDRADRSKIYPNPLCTGGPKCPLKISHHPPAGEEFLLGCGLCRTGKSSA